MRNKNKNSKSFEQWCIDNNRQDVLDRWDYELNDCKPSEISFGSSSKKYYFKCPKGIHKSELKNISSFTSGKQNNLNCNQCNMIATTHPYLIKYFTNKEDSEKYSKGSHANIPMKCPDCKFEKLTMVSNLVKQGFGCPKCKKNYYPERFFINFLEQLNIKFSTQLSKTTFEWCNDYYYDFYIQLFNIIIETHGLQHYKQNKGKGNWVNLKETQKRDKIKEQLAKENNINNYIVLDCRYSTLKWIKNNIMNSELPTLLNFKENDIDWLKCHESACKGLIKIACDLWNEGKTTIIEISKKLNVCRNTVKTYIKQGSKLGLCNYNSEEEIKKSNTIMQKKRCIKVICLTTGEIFNSLIEAENKYNIYNSSISRCCKGKYKSAGKHLETEEPLKWMYYDEYIEQQNKSF